jgi:porin
VVSRTGHSRAWKLARTLLIVVFAQAMVLSAPASADDTVACGQSPPTDPQKPYQADLLGDLGGVRPTIGQYGLTFALSEASEIVGNPTGGTRRGAIYEGLTDASLALNLRSYFNWPGVLCVRAYQIHGRGLSAHNLNNLMTVSSIEATPTTRLLELWYEQQVGDWLRIRIGQQGADQDFIISDTAKLFVNSTFGWPGVPTNDLPSGGPAYPLSALGVRLHIKVNDELAVLVGLFNGDPAGPGLGDPQKRDASGTAFRVNDGAFALFEARYRPGKTDNSAIYKIGAWFNSEKFADQHFDSNGVSLASPLSNGMPRLFGNNYSFYGIIDQPLFQADDGTGLAIFARAMGAPGDRNLVDFYFDTGLAYKNPFGRDGDSVGIGFGYARISNSARSLDRDAAFSGTAFPVRSRESVIEATYQFQVTDWWELQPDFQYITAPSGGVLNPNAPGRKIGDAAVLGLRSTISF